MNGPPALLHRLALTGDAVLAATLYALAGVESRWNPAAVGRLGEVSAWQVLAPRDWRFNTNEPPADLLAQADWIMSGRIVAWLQGRPTDQPAPRWWRHGARAAPDDLDLQRERDYATYFREALDALSGKAPWPAPGGAGDGLIFSGADLSRFGGSMTTTTGPVLPAPLPGSIKDRVDAIRKAADKVRATVDLVGGIVSSLPFIGPIIGGYVRTIVLVVDSLDAAIDALDNSLP